jgi:hypothetical protein
MIEHGRQSTPTRAAGSVTISRSLRSEPHSLMIVEPDALVLFLLFLQHPDLLFEIIERLPEFLVEAISQTRHHPQPPVPFHSPERLIDWRAVGKSIRQTMAPVKEMKILTLG